MPKYVATVVAYLKQHTQIGNCCTHCILPDHPTSDWEEYSFSCPGFGHAVHGGDGYNITIKYETLTIIHEHNSIAQVNTMGWYHYTITTIWCFYLKVPLSTSCPLSLTWIPSLRRLPNARASPKAQSASPFFTISPLALRIRFNPGMQTQTIFAYEISNSMQRDIAAHVPNACI